MRISDLGEQTPLFLKSPKPVFSFSLRGTEDDEADGTNYAIGFHDQILPSQTFLALYRLTIQVVIQLPLTPKQMLRFSTSSSYWRIFGRKDPIFSSRTFPNVL